MAVSVWRRASHKGVEVLLQKLFDLFHGMVGDSCDNMREPALPIGC